MKTQIVEFNEFETKLSEFKSRYDNVIYNLDNPSENKLARSDRRSIGTVIANLDRKHKELKAPLKEKVDLIDGERKRIKDMLLDVQLKIKTQIESHELKIKQHKEMLESKVNEIQEFAIFIDFEPDSECIKSRLDKLSKIEVDESFEDLKANAALAHIESSKKLNNLLSETLEKEENQRIEAERIKQEEEKRRKEREEALKLQAKKEAEAEAKRKIEAAEKAKQAAKKAAEKAKENARKAQEKAKADLILAKKKAAEEAKKQAELAAQKEREKLEREQAKIERERKKQKAEEERKKSLKKHREKIFLEIRDDLIKSGFHNDDIKLLIKLILDNKVRHLKIEF